MTTRELTTQIIFQGDDNLNDLLCHHMDVVHEIWRHISGLHDAKVKIYVNSPDDYGMLEWSICIRSHLGIQSFVVRQINRASSILIVAE